MKQFIFSIGLLLVILSLTACNNQSSNMGRNSFKGEAKGDYLHYHWMN